MKYLCAILAAICLVASAATNAAIAPQTPANPKSAIVAGVDAISIPRMLSYQGKLTDTLGIAVPDTTYNLTFRLYTQPSGGSAFWNEMQTVRTKAGLFAVLLGSVASIGSMPDAGTVYLGMAVEYGAELGPRLQLVSAAYAYSSERSASADQLQGKDTTALDARYVNEAQADAVTSAMIVNGTIAAADLGQMGAATNQVLKWTGAAWAPRNDSAGGGGSVPDSVPGSFAVTTDLRVYGKGRIGPSNTNAGTAAFVAGSGNSASANYSSVAGGSDNAASGASSHVGGGSENHAGGDYAFVGGGQANYAAGVKSAVVGGSDNEAHGLFAAIGGGRANTAGDTADDTCATVAGGYANLATDKFATVGGGKFDTASSMYAVVGGGCRNAANGNSATVAGGQNNLASATYATVGGGYLNEASVMCAVVGGGSDNRASEQNAAVAGGGSNHATGRYAAVGGGSGNDASATAATVAGGGGNEAVGAYASAGGGFGNTAGDAADDTAAVVAGGYHNAATGMSATVGGGQNDTASHAYATVAGGSLNRATGDAAMVGGGWNNVASGGLATVGGGQNNAAAASCAVVGGGSNNSATGFYSMVPGGYDCQARGYASLAAGRCARAGHGGTFVWSDSAATSDSVYTTGANQWRVRARGGTWFFSNLAMTTGAYLAAGSNAWASACDSANKEDFRPVDRKALLDKVAALRVRDYKMRDQNDGTRHIGPVAQDFHSAFGYGETETGINTADADGVLLAAVQALCEQNQALGRRVAELEAKLADK